MKQNVIAEVKDLNISFATLDGQVDALRNINYQIRQGQMVALVGESGSGKSVSARTFMGLTAENAIIGDSSEVRFNQRR